MIEAGAMNAAKVAVLLAAGIILAGAAVIALLFHAAILLPSILISTLGALPRLPPRAPIPPRPRR